MHSDGLLWDLNLIFSYTCQFMISSLNTFRCIRNKTNSPPHGSHPPKNENETWGHLQTGIFNFILSKTAELSVYCLFLISSDCLIDIIIVEDEQEKQLIIFLLFLHLKKQEWRILMSAKKRSPRWTTCCMSTLCFPADSYASWSSCLFCQTITVLTAFWSMEVL